MRVVLCVPSLDPRFGGPLTTGEALASAYRDLGHDAIMVGADGPGSSSEDVVALRTAWRFRATPVPRDLGRLSSAVSSADVVHVLGYRDPVGTYAAHIAIGAGIPYVLEPTGMTVRRFRRRGLKRAFDATIGRREFRHASAVMAASELERREIASSDLPAERLVVRPNGIEPEAPSGGAGFRDALGIPGDGFVVLALARLSAIKGLDVLVRAAARADADVHVVIAGPDEGDGTHVDLQRWRRVLSLRERVHLLPEGLWGAERLAAYDAADAFCLCSRYESFGTTALEAAACGLPVVVTSACGVADLLPGGSTIMVATGDDVSLARALGSLASDRTMRDAALAAAAAVRETFSWRRLAQAQLEVYRPTSPPGEGSGAPAFESA